MTLSKKVVGIVLVLLVAAAALWFFMPQSAGAQVPVQADDILCYTEDEANPVLPDPFDLDFGPCDQDEEPEPPQCDEGEVLEGNECVPEADGGDNGGGDNETPGDNGGSSNNEESSGGGGGGGSHKKKSDGEVLGASTEACTVLLTTYLRMGQSNDLAETVELQNFLMTELGLTNLITGTFDEATKNAVEQFQLKYADEVLAPWVPHGLESAATPTGYVYKTTQRMINKIHCTALDIPMPQLP